MLAQNFKTAEELGLSETGLTALIQVLKMMESGDLKWAPRHQPQIPNGFNMGVVWKENECGTVGCIAGWMMHQSPPGAPIEIILPPDDPRRHARSKLFMPRAYWRKPYTLEQAIHAIRTFLVTGTPDWGY